MTMIVPKSRAEWLALRHKYVSSTESAALFGLSPYMTAYELAVQKQCPEPDPDWAGNERMKWGIRLQHAIAKGIAEEYGVKIRALNGYSTHSLGHVKAGASFDYEIVGIVDGEYSGDTILRDLYAKHGAGVLEIKNVDGLVFRDQWKSDDGIEPPAHIEIQVQHQLACIARQWAAIGVLVNGNTLHLMTRERDDDVIKAVLTACERFWTDLGKGILPPVELPADAAIISQVYRIAEPGKVIDADEEIEALCAEYRAAADRATAAEAEKNTAKAKILMKIGDAERVIGAAFTISAGTVGECEVSYTRKAYRNVRITAVKAKKSTSKETVNG
jgi:putative phage-type endonuclease